MAYQSGDYLGYSEEEFNILKGYQAFMDSEWFDNFELLEAGNGKMYCFKTDDSGDESDFQFFLEDEGLDEFGMTWYSYNFSTNSLSGF